MKKSGINAKYVDSNNFVENFDKVSLQTNTVLPQFVDPIRYFSKNLWTNKNNKIIKTENLVGGEIFEVEEQPNNVLVLKANIQKFLSEYFENGIYRKDFDETSRENWIQFITNLIPNPSVTFEDLTIDFNEPVNIPEMKSELPSGINYINREFFYNFYSMKFENLVNGTIFDTSVLPSAYDLAIDNQIDFRAEGENLVLSLGGFIEGNVVDQLYTANKFDDSVKQYFDIYADTFERPEVSVVASEIRSRNKIFAISKNRTNLVNRFRSNFAPFPFYVYAEFSNLSSQKNDLVHIFDSLGAIQNEFLTYVSQVRQSFNTRNFIYDKEIIEEKEVNYFDLQNWLAYQLALREGTDSYATVESVVRYTNLIDYMNKTYKNSIRKFNEFFNKSCDFEVIAYKIEKKQFSYDSKTIQTFYVLPDESELIKFFDTQIKYGVEYFYKISAFTIVIGNKYSYEPYEYKSELEFLEDREFGRYKIKYKNSTNYKVFELELTRFSGAILETPLTKPVMEFMEDNSNLRFSLLNSSPESYEDFNVIENNEFQLFQLLKKTQDNNEPTLIKSINTNSEDRLLQIYRLTEPPRTMLSFQGKLYKTVALDGNKNAFLDKILTNVKYYYVFRFINKHGIPSNTSDVYEVIFKDEEGYQYVESKIINLKSIQAKQDTKQMRRYLLVRPSIIQTQPSYVEDVKTIEGVKFGPQESVWKKSFLMRITSKKTNRVLEFNFTPKIKNK